MKINKTLYKTASWSFVLLGIGHVITHFLEPRTPEQLDMIQQMKDFVIEMPGTTSNLLLFHEGFSITMGMLISAFGLINLVFLKTNRESVNSFGLLLTNSIVSGLMLILSVIYFFFVPIAFSALSFLCFTSLLFMKKD